jgi:hypothetical protein
MVKGAAAASATTAAVAARGVAKEDAISIHIHNKTL